MAYIEAKGIYKTFGRGDAAVHALRGISLSVDKGEMVGIGTHKELMENCKIYQEIAYSQLSKEELA